MLFIANMFCVYFTILSSM